MKRQQITILIVLTFLILGLVFGSPIEFTKQMGHRIATIVAGLFIGTTIFILFRQLFTLKHRVTKIVLVTLTSIVTLPYLFNGLFSIPTALFSSRYPMWQDITIYTNDKGEKIIGQFIEISGSLYDYQNRKIYKDFGNGVRISIPYPDSKLNGVWTIEDVATGIEKTRTLKNGSE